MHLYNYLKGRKWVKTTPTQLSGRVSVLPELITESLLKQNTTYYGNQEGL